MSQIVMLIEKVGDELEMTLKEENNLSPTNEGSQRQRRDKGSGQGREQARNREMKEQRNKRKAHSHEAHVEHDLTGIHQTIILLDKPNANDQVVFISTQPFVVDVEFDPGLRAHDAEDDPRRSPFTGWDTPQSSVLDTSGGRFNGFHVVSGVFNNDKRKNSDGTKDLDKTRPTDQMFYKAIVWSQGLKLDPDFFCDR